jgi:CRISPR type I-E-associated protein CasB/Cse2
MNATVEAPLHPTEPPTLEKQLLGVARYVTALQRGPRAILRRVNADSGGVPPEEFWRIVERYSITPREENFWLRVIPLLVEHPHQPGLAPGVALARSGVSPARLEKWLRLERDDAIRETSRLLARIEGGFDWTQFGKLLRFWSEDSRRTLARQFFLSPEYRARTATSGE